MMTMPGVLSDELVAQLRAEYTREQLVELTLDVMKWNYQKVSVALRTDAEIQPGDLGDLAFDDHGNFIRPPGLSSQPDPASNVPSMRLHVVERGTGPTVVFLHGMGSSSATWNACMNLLAPTHRVVALDLLGHGASPVPDDPAEYTRDAALADIDELLATVPPAVLVGHSLGGYLAMAHAATRPNVARGIVVLNTGPGFRDADKREQWNERSRRNAHRFGVPVQAAELNLQHDSVVMDRLAEITVPTLVLAGGADRPEYTASGQYIERKMAHARLVVVEGGEHAMHEASHATEVAEIIAEFVASLSPVA